MNSRFKGDLSQFEPIKSEEELTNEHLRAFHYFAQSEEPFNGDTLPRDVELLGQRLARLVANNALRPDGNGKKTISQYTFSVRLAKLIRLNPKVGAVLCRAEENSNSYEFIGCCRGAFDGDNHAEHSLLFSRADLSVLTKNDFFFTTLEPCTQNSRNKWSRACSKLLIDRQVKNLYIGLMDPNPLITGYGYFTLFKKISGIRIMPFDSDIRSDLVADNKEYLSQFEYTDFEQIRSVALSFDKYVSYEAIDSYLLSRLDDIDLTNIKEKDLIRLYSEFYRDMMMRNYIVRGGDDSLDPFRATDPFALFFHKEPQGLVDGSTILIHKGSRWADMMIIDGPLSLFYDSNPDAERTFCYIIIHEYGFPEEIRDYDDEASFSGRRNLFERFCDRKFGLPSRILREAITNALIHRDYSSGAFTKIDLNSDSIVIVNPCKNTELPSGSVPPNPKLMRLFMDYGQAERQGLGLTDLEDNGIESGPRDNYWRTFIPIK